MKKGLLVILLSLIPVLALADGRRCFQTAKTLYENHQYQDAINEFKICQEYYDDDNTISAAEFAQIPGYIAKCKESIQAESQRRRSLESQARQERIDNNLFYVSTNALSLTSEYAGFKESVSSALSDAGFKTSRNENDAAWKVSVSAVAKSYNYSNESHTYTAQAICIYSVYNLFDGRSFDGTISTRGSHTHSYEYAVEEAYGTLVKEFSNELSRKFGKVTSSDIIEDDTTYIWVVVTGNDNVSKDYSDIIAADFQDKLLQSTKRNFDVSIGKDNDFFASEVEQIKYMNSGDVNPEHVKKFGKAGMRNGAEYLCVIQIKKIGDEYSFIAKIFNVETGSLDKKFRIARYPMDKDSSIDDANAIRTVSLVNRTLIERLKLLEGVQAKDNNDAITSLQETQEKQDLFLRTFRSEYANEQATLNATKLDEADLSLWFLDKSFKKKYDAIVTEITQRRQDSFLFTFKSEQANAQMTLNATDVTKDELSHWLSDNSFKNRYDAIVNANQKNVDYKKDIGYSFVPGMAQIKDGSNGLGIAFITAETICLGGVGVSQYMKNLNTVNINSTHNTDEKVYYIKMANMWNITTYVSAVCAIGVYTWNVIDGISRAKRKNNKDFAFFPYYTTEHSGVMLTYYY